MSWISENRNFIRSILLIFFLLSMMGPWMYDLIHVPAEYDCDKPFIRLEGDFCGYPMSGFEFFKWFGGGFIGMLASLVTGETIFPDRIREFFFVSLSLFPMLPFFSTLLLMWRKDPRRLQTINLAAWILALIPPLFIFIFQLRDQAFRLWGLWLYILVAIGAFVIEILFQKAETKDMKISRPYNRLP
jgi:hypothetical protein